MITRIDKDTFRITTEVSKIVKLSELKKELATKQFINADIEATDTARSLAKPEEVKFYKLAMPKEDTTALENLIKQLESEKWEQ